MRNCVVEHLGGRVDLRATGSNPETKSSSRLLQKVHQPSAWLRCEDCRQSWRIRTSSPSFLMTL